MVVFLTISRHHRHRHRHHQDLLINAKNGRITEVKIFSDSLYPQMIDDLTLALHGACVWAKPSECFRFGCVKLTHTQS
jgi:hypothetical protein